MKKILMGIVALALAAGIAGCGMRYEAEAPLPPEPELVRPAMPEGIPDFTKGEGPGPEDAKKGDWYLHCSGARGWAYRDKMDKCDGSRQILITKVPVDSSVRYDLKVGDVILGVNGKYFSRHPIREFRDATVPVRNIGGSFDVIMWRTGWEKDKAVTLSLAFLPIDFTKGEKPGLAVDWNLGPTGARGWMQGQHNESVITRQILITSVEKKSPADGILEKGDVILGVEGKDFDSDARRAIAEAITSAETEAGNGQLSVRRYRDGKTEDVTIPIEVLGSYSSTTPWNCEKTQKILDRACAYLLRKDVLGSRGPNAGEPIVAALALMSTGDPEHMKLAKGHVYKLLKMVVEGGDYPPSWGYPAWGWGYGNLLMTEYYLLTRDSAVLPAIRKYSQAMARGQSGVGSWGHSMAMPDHSYCNGYGAMNQAGNVCLLSLLLAKRCGVTSDEIEQAITRGYDYLSFFINKQPIPYGDHISIDCNSHDDNGKCSSAAVAFSVMREQQGTDFYSRMTVASHSVREQGHTGNWWSFLWGPLGSVRAGQKGCSAFLKELTWLHDLERRWDGGFTYQGKMNNGYGVDEETGRQKGGAEHQYGHWDTTGGRILMYTLPKKRLAISGKDVTITPIPAAALASVIEAGRPSVRGNKFSTERYDSLPAGELFGLLGSWSPVVRHHAALSLAKKEDDYVVPLLDILKAPTTFSRYGACTALRKMGKKSVTAVEPLIGLLNTDDQLLQVHAIKALGAIGDERGVKALLKLAAGEFQNDRKGIMHRIVARSLFMDSPLADSIDGVDRALLFPAVKRLLRCKGGHERSMVADKVLKKLSFEELQGLWTDMIPAMKECAPTGVMFASGVRVAVLEIMTENKVEEGMDMLLEFMKIQKMHGSGGRNKVIMDLLTRYGAAAKPLVPEMEEYVTFLEGEHPHTDKGRPGPHNFYRNQVPHVKGAIEAIKASEEKPDLVSIAPYLKK